MVTLRDLHRYQTARSMVQLEDGRVGKIVRVDTTFPGNRTEVSIYTLDVRSAAPAEPATDRVAGGQRANEQRASERGAAPSGGGDPAQDEFPEDAAGRGPTSGPGVTRVSLDRIVGLAKLTA